MGKASRAKRDRPNWARHRDVAAIVRRVEAIEAGITGRGSGIWSDLDFVRSERAAHRLPDWPAWCWLPSTAAMAFTEREDWARV
ncbi:MAG: hypothetical protein WD649_04885, partial [Thermoleophilaceae bacterium]